MPIAIQRETSSISGLWLRREGDHVVVLVEQSGAWVEVIREHFAGPFSHIIEPSGIRAVLAKAAP